MSEFADFLTAYNGFKALPCPAANNLTGQALAGKTLVPGVYCFSSTANLTSGNLTLSGPSSGTWVFQVGTGLTTGAAQVVMAGGGAACNVYWALGSNGTIGTNTKFQGNILAGFGSHLHRCKLRLGGQSAGPNGCNTDWRHRLRLRQAVRAVR